MFERTTMFGGKCRVVNLEQGPGRVPGKGSNIMLGKTKLSLVFGMGLVLVLAGCQTTPTQQGALTGALLGAGAGAIVGNQVHGQSGEGALIGAGVGALTGALIGDKVDENRSRNQQRQVYAPQQAPAPSQPSATPSGHWETRTKRSASGETYEVREWVAD
jgi:surface antigen